MALVGPHSHKLRKYQYRNMKQWTCKVPFCKYLTRNPLDLMWQVFECAKCSKFFRFEEEDTKQKTEDVLCPECNKDSTQSRIVDMVVINQVAERAVIESVNDTIVFKEPITIKDEPVDTDLVLELIKQEMEKEKEQEKDV